MDELRRHAAQLIDCWQRLARGQRITAIAVLAASTLGFVLFRNRSASDWQPVANGREFTTAELTAVQTAWRQAGLTEYRRDARKLLVPSAHMAQYTVAIPKSERSQDAADNERSQPLLRANPFTSHEQFEQLKDHALRTTVERQLKVIPAIADAEVNWARGKGRSAFSAHSKVTATISVLPRAGFDLTPELAQSLRTAVAGMIPDLNAEDIVVLDQSTGFAMTDDSDPLIVEQIRSRQQVRAARQLESRIATAIAHVPNATVQAKLVEKPRTTHRHITAKPIFGSAVTWLTDAPDKLVEFSPSAIVDHDSQSLPVAMDAGSSVAWHVAVQIPQSYFEASVARTYLASEHRGARSADLHEAESSRLRMLIQNALPPDTALAELSIEPSLADTAAAPSAVSFAAWPHVACGLLAMLCVAIASVRRRTTNSDFVGIERAVELSVPSSETLDLLPSSALRIDEEQLGGAPPAASEPLTDLARLHQLDPLPLAEALRHERPQAIAVLLTRLSTRLASACLSQLTLSLQTDVIRRLKSLGEVPDELVAEIARSVCQRLVPPAATIRHESTNRIAHLLLDSPAQKVFA